MKFSSGALLALPTLALAQLNPQIFKLAINQHLSQARSALGEVVSALDECKAQNFASRMNELVDNQGAIPEAICYLHVPELQQLSEDLMDNTRSPTLYNLFAKYGGPVVAVEFSRNEHEVRVVSTDRITRPTATMGPFKARQQLLSQMSEIGALAQQVSPSAPVPRVPAAPVPNPNEFADAPPVTGIRVIRGKVSRPSNNYPANFLVTMDKAAVNRDVPAAAARWVEALAGSMIPALMKEVTAADALTLSPQEWLQRMTVLKRVVDQLVKLTMAANSRKTLAYAKHFSQLMLDFSA